MEHNVEFDGVPIKLGRTEYIIPALALDDMERMLPRIDALAKASVTTLSKESIDTVVDIVHLSLKRNYPEMERGFVMSRMDTRNVKELVSVTLKGNGLEVGNVQQPVEAPSSPSSASAESSGSSSQLPAGQSDTSAES